MSDPLNATPSFSPTLQSSIHRAACRLVAEAVGGGMPQTTAPLPPEAAPTIVSGLFVTLKREGKLRSCFGTYGVTMRLDAALPKASHGAATSDPRFPPIVPEEVCHLHLEISMLFGLEPLASQGQERQAEVEVGRHGLEISCAGRRGLLLPRVAVDFQLDALGFLRQVCHKAGLAADAWMLPEAQLTRFESHCFGGFVADHDATV